MIIIILLILLILFKLLLGDNDGNDGAVVEVFCQNLEFGSRFDLGRQIRILGVAFIESILVD